MHAVFFSTSSAPLSSHFENVLLHFIPFFAFTFNYSIRCGGYSGLFFSASLIVCTVLITSAFNDTSINARSDCCWNCWCSHPYSCSSLHPNRLECIFLRSCWHLTVILRFVFFTLVRSFIHTHIWYAWLSLVFSYLEPCECIDFPIIVLCGLFFC